MSNTSVLKNIPELMGQPAGIAALASLGIHGAIALILPLVPVNTAKSDKQETTPQAVGITNLSPQEQARLPQTAIAKPQQANATPMQPQPGVASQLPPMPDFAGASPLPPLPAFPGNSQPLPPLPQSTNVNVPMFPRGQRVATGGFNINTGFRANPLPRRNYPVIAGNPRIGDVVGSQIPAGRPVNVPDYTSGEFQIPGSPRVADPPLSSPLPEGVPEGMAARNGNMNNNPVAVNGGNPEFVTPTGEPLQAGGNLSLANQEMPGVTPLPDNSLTQKIATVLENNQNQQPQNSSTGNTGNISDENSANTRVTKALLMAQHYQQAQQNHGQLQTKQPLNLTLDRDGLKDVVDVGLVVKADGTIDDLKFFTNDGKQLSFEDSNAVRKFLADYLQKNPPANGGKPIYLTANIAPGNAAEKPAANADGVTIPTKPLTVNNNANNNSNNTEQKPVRSLEVIRPNTNNPNSVEVAPVRPITPTTTKPQLEAEPSFSEPVRLRTPRPVTIPTQQPPRNPLLETTPRSVNQINQPSGESPKPAGIQSWRERLTPEKNNADDDKNENSNQSRGIQKLRELAEIKNQSNP